MIEIQVPGGWVAHALEVDNELANLDSAIMRLQAQLYDLTFKKNKLLEHLSLSVTAIAKSECPTLVSEIAAKNTEYDMIWSQDRKIITATEKVSPATPAAPPAPPTPPTTPSGVTPPTK